MLYKGGFSDINGKTYEVNIQTGTVTTEVPITLSDDPVNINVPSESLFFPIKSRECNIEIVSDEYIMDMYQTSSRNAKVWVRDCEANKVIFFGYLTPNEYSQSYSHLDTIQLNAVDALSTLKDFRFEFSGTTPKYVTMLSLVVSFMKDAGYTGTLFIPNTYDYINGLDSRDAVPTGHNVLEYLYVSEANFVDDDEEKTHWTKYEVLQEIMQFMGWSICPYGHDVYIVDYKAEAATDAVPYFEYNLTNDTTYVENLSNAPIVITKDTNAAPGTPVFSLDEVYNKISISDNLYEVDEIAPKIDDNIMEDIELPNGGRIMLGSSQWTTTTRTKHWWKADDISTEVSGYDYQTFKIFKEGSGFTHHFYERDSLNEVNNEGFSNCYDTGSTSEYTGNRVNKYINTIGAVMQHYAYRSNEGPNNLPTSLDWEDYLTFFITDDTILPYEDWWGRLIIGPETDPNSIFKYQRDPVLEYQVDEEINWKPSSGKSWITIDGQLFYQYNNEEFDNDRIYTVNSDKHIITSSPIDKSTNCSIKSYCNLNRHYDGGSNPNYGLGFPTWKMKLQIGEGNKARWWNGNSWVSYETTFYIKYNNNPSNHDDEFMPAFSWASVVPNTDYTDQVGKNCYAIPINSQNANDPSFGKMHLWIYTPLIVPLEVITLYTEVYSFDTHKKWYTLPTTIFCKDFEIGYVYTDTSVWYEQTEDGDKEDVIYTNVINETYTNEFSNLEFKINTQIKDKPISRSYVCTENGYLNSLHHKYGDGIKTQEKNIIDLYYYHHNEPKKIYTCNLHGCTKPNDVFTPNVIDGRFLLNYYNWDIHNDNIEINMIQY